MSIESLATATRLLIAGDFYMEKLELYKEYLRFIVRYANYQPKLIEAVALRNFTSSLNVAKIVG